MKSLREIDHNTQVEWDNLYTKYWKQDAWHGDGNRYNAVLPWIPQKGKILDMGCGNGTFFWWLHPRRPELELHGCDFSKVSLEMARTKCPAGTYRLEDLTKGTSFPDNHFDCVITMEVIEHMKRPEDLVLEAKRILKPGGNFIFTVPKDGDTIFHLWLYNKFDVDRFRLLVGKEGESKVFVSNAVANIFAAYGKKDS